MSGRQAFDKLTKVFTPERRARVDAHNAELRAAMPFHELRQAQAMNRKQGRISRLRDKLRWKGSLDEMRRDR